VQVQGALTIKNISVEEATLEPAPTKDKLQFSYFPDYARFVREHHLLSYIAHQLEGARALNTPLLKIFGDLPDQQIIELSIPGHTEFLKAAEENKLSQLISDSMRKWLNDQLEIVGKDDIEAEDITQVSHLRKAALLHFLPLYTGDLTTALAIIREIDVYQLESDTLSTNTYISILQNRINEHTRALRQSEEQLLEAQTIADLGSFTWNLRDQSVDVSPQLLLVLDLDEVRDFENFLKKVHPADQPKVRAAMEEAYKSGNFECEYRLETRDGNERIIWSRGVISFDDNNRPHLFKGTVMDVTEKHHMVQRLQRSEELYKQAQTLSHLGNWTWDLMHDRITWSDELYRIYGLEPGSPIDFNYIYQFNHPDDAVMVIDAVRQAIAEQKPFEYFYRIVSRDGQTKILHARGEVLVHEGKVYKVLGTLQDVTAQQITEQQLRSSQEFIRKIADTTPSLIASYNVNTGNYTYISKALKTLLGYEPEEVIDNAMAFFLEAIHPDDLAPLMEKNKAALEQANLAVPPDGNEMVVEFKYRMRHRDGNYRWFHTFGTIFDRNDQGKIEHVLNVSIDITSQELAEQQLQQRNIQLQQSNTSLEEYAYVASHDLKEPLRKITTFSDRLLAMNNEPLSESARTYLRKIMESSRRMQTMISDLLAVSVISGNKAFEKHSLQHIVDEVVQTLEYKIEEKGAVVTTDGLPEARVVPSQFRQLFQNLIGNSLKFTREGVTPVISISHKFLEPAAVRDLELAKAARYLCVEVKDNGIGFDNQYSNKIFAIFQRLHGKTEYEGTGIGLAICRKIAENHGGIITANGTNNQGSTFTIIFPL